MERCERLGDLALSPVASSISAPKCAFEDEYEYEYEYSDDSATEVYEGREAESELSR